MSPKFVDIDLAIEDLKKDASNERMRAKSRANLSRPVRSNTRKLGLVGLTAGIAIVCIWPRGTSGTAWAQALGASKSAGRVHYKIWDSNGKGTSEEWTDGVKNARIMYARNGVLFNEWRSNGKKLFNYFDFNALRRVDPNPNVHPFGMLTKLSGPPIVLSINLGGRLDHLMDLQKGEIIRQEPTKTDSGPATRYELKTKRPFQDQLVVIVDDKSGLIVQMEGKDGKWKSAFDYPESIPESVFEPVPQVAKGIEVYDIDQQKQDIQRTIQKGLGTVNGVTLRLVVLDANGALWALWTGSQVDGKMLKPFTAQGLKLGPASGLAKFTTNAEKKRANIPVVPNGPRIYGMARAANTKVGDHVSITIPSKKGAATFRNVPVMRIGFPQHFFPWSG